MNEELAKKAYQAYGQTTDFKNYQGLPMPEWENLPEGIQKAWCNAAGAIADQAWLVFAGRLSEQPACNTVSVIADQATLKTKVIFMNNNRVTQDQISSLLDSAETEEHTFWKKDLIVAYKLPSGFTVCGRGACIDPANFDIEIGRKVARENAEDQLWQLEGYRLQHELHQNGIL